MNQHIMTKDIDDPYSSDREIYRLLTQETRYYIIQYILAHPDNLPTLEELSFAISKSKSTIHEHLGVLQNEDIIDVYELPSSERKRDSPSKFYGLTVHGIETVRELGFLSAKSSLQNIYSQVDKPSRIKRYESAKRPEKKNIAKADSSEYKQGQSIPESIDEFESPSIIERAFHYAEKESPENTYSGGSSVSEEDIVVIGCGGSGNNTVNRLSNLGVQGATTVAVNTDEQHLNLVDTDRALLIGENLTDGLGAGGDVEIGRKSAIKSEEDIKDILQGARLAIVTAGFGGGTGTGAAPVVARFAREVGATTVSYVSIPFDVEKNRVPKAQKGAPKLYNNSDTVIAIDNNRLLDYVPNATIGKVFSVVDQIFAESIKQIVETITLPSLINLAFNDVLSVFSDGGLSVLLPPGERQDSVEATVSSTMQNQLVDVDYEEADQGIVHIAGGKDLTLNMAESIVNTVAEWQNKNTEIIWGARVSDDLESNHQVSVLLTGVGDIEDFVRLFEEDHNGIEKFENQDIGNSIERAPV